MSFNDMLLVSYNGADLVDHAGGFTLTEAWAAQLRRLAALTRYWPRHVVMLTFDPEVYGHHKCGHEWKKFMLIAANSLSALGVTVVDCTDRVRKMVIDSQPDYHLPDLALTSKCLWWTDRLSGMWKQLMRDLHELVVAGGIPTFAKQTSIANKRLIEHKRTIASPWSK